MEDFSKLLTSIAAVIGAVAWPALIFALAHIFKLELKHALVQMASAIKKLNKAAFGGISFELNRIAEEETSKEPDKGGHVTARQVEAAARIKIKAQDVEPETLINELDALCLQYDVLRSTMSAGSERTRAMTGIVVKMRSLAPSVENYISRYKNSRAPGSRLAAVAIMQMVPPAADLQWLLKRFSVEQPFIFYHAALALQNLANYSNKPHEKLEISSISKQALSLVEGFSGTPDKNTISVLKQVTDRIYQNLK